MTDGLGQAIADVLYAEVASYAVLCSTATDETL